MPRRHKDTEVILVSDLESLNEITEKIIGCAIEVHRNLGPGLLESIYEIPILYKGLSLGNYRLDLLIEDSIIVELKAVDRIEAVFEAQLLTYLKITNKQLGLLINFNQPLLKNGIKRIIL